MVQNLTNETTIKQYLLGQLPSEELEKIEERFLTDQEFSEELLMVEDELFDDYALGLLPAHEQENFTTHFLSVPLQRRKLELAKAIERYISEATSAELKPEIASPVHLPDVYEITASYLKRCISSFQRFLSRHFRRKQAAEKSLDGSILIQPKDDGTWERLLSEAHTNRNLLASLVEGDWRGLCLLAQLRSSAPAREYELASRLNLSIGDVTLTLARLVQFGLVAERQGEFACTSLGTDLLQKLEKVSGINLS